MKRLRFERAFCVELNRIISPYLARELYFDEGSEYYNIKLNFKCCDSMCEGELVAVGVYSSKRSKVALHFRKKHGSIHTCEKDINNKISGYEGKNIEDPEAFKITRYPSELIINSSNKKKNSTKSISQDNEEGEGYLTKSIGKEKKISRTEKFKTTSFEHIVDCFLNGEESILSNMNLTIGSKTKKFKYFFKKVQYYEDEKGLIYYGEIESIKKYGANYKIIFKNRRYKSDMFISIYIKDELIKKYSRRKMFREQIDALVEFKERNILCFFVDAYPIEKIYTINGKKLTSVQVEIRNLHNLVFAFD